MRLTGKGRTARVAACAIIVLICITASSQESKSRYHLARTTVLGGDGGWDYLTFDSEARRLYISHETQVVVFDPDTDKVVGNIADNQGVHGTAIVTDLGRGFISDGKANVVRIFDLSTLKVVGEVKSTGSNPDCIIYDPASKRVFTFNGRSGTATAIDAASGQVVGTVDLGGGKPEFAVADGQGHVWVNVEDKDWVVRLNSNELKVETHFSLGDCHEPASMAMDRNNRRLFVGCRNRVLAVVDADSGKVLATVAIGAGVDANIFDPGSGLIFASSRDGKLTVIHEDSPEKFTVVDSISTQVGAGTSAFDPKTGNLYLVTADLGASPPATTASPHPRAVVVQGTFKVLTVTK